MMMKVLIYIILNLLIYDAVAQQCIRPESVYILLENNKSDSISYSKSGTTSICYTLVYKGTKDVFCQVENEVKLLSSQLLDFIYYTPVSLRKKEIEILKCEVSKGEKIGKIYVDLDINDVFKNIYLIEKRRGSYFSIKVNWQDSKE